MEKDYDDIWSKIFDDDGALIFRALADQIRFYLVLGMISMVILYTVEHIRPKHLKILEFKSENKEIQ